MPKLVTACAGLVSSVAYCGPAAGPLPALLSFPVAVVRVSAPGVVLFPSIRTFAHETTDSDSCRKLSTAVRGWNFGLNPFLPSKLYRSTKFHSQPTEFTSQQSIYFAFFLHYSLLSALFPSIPLHCFSAVRTSNFSEGISTFRYT